MELVVEVLPEVVVRVAAAEVVAVLLANKVRACMEPQCP